MRKRQSVIILLAAAYSYRMESFATAARALGYKVLEGIDVPPPMLRQDGSQLALDYRDLKRSQRRLQQFIDQQFGGSERIKAVIGLDDSGALLAVNAAEGLGLTHNSYHATELARDKYQMRQAFAEHGVPSTPFTRFHANDDPAALANKIQNGTDGLSFPVVIKPTNRSGSQGVMRADDPAGFNTQFLRLRKLLATDTCQDVLVESFIPGKEIALEGLLTNGQLQVLAIFDKPDPLDGPFFEETIYTTPSRHSDIMQAKMIEAAANAAAAMGLRTGPIHAEMRITPDGPVLLEVAARSIGGQCGKSLQFGGDQSLEMVLIRHAVGEDVTHLQHERPASGVMMMPIPKSGLLRAVRGVEAAGQLPMIQSIEISAPLNYQLTALPEGDGYLGFIFADGPTPHEVEDALRLAYDSLTFVIEEPLTILS